MAVTKAKTKTPYACVRKKIRNTRHQSPTIRLKPNVITEMRKRKTRVLRCSRLSIYDAQKIRRHTPCHHPNEQPELQGTKGKKPSRPGARKIKIKIKKKERKLREVKKKRHVIMKSLLVCSNFSSLDQAGVKSSPEKYRCAPSVLFRSRRRALMVCRKKKGQLPNPMQCSQF